MVFTSYVAGLFDDRIMKMELVNGKVLHDVYWLKYQQYLMCWHQGWWSVRWLIKAGEASESNSVGGSTDTGRFLLIHYVGADHPSCIH